MSTTEPAASVRASPFVRPDPPPPFTLTRRDVAVLRSVFVHRILTAELVHVLHFAPSSLRVCQARLRVLWAHGLLDRFTKTRLWRAGEPSPVRRPLYLLTMHGADVLARSLGEDAATTRGRLADPRGPLPTLEHNLVAAEFLIAVEVALKGRDGVELVGVEPESELWAQTAVSPSGQRRTPFIVSDGAFTLHVAGAAAPATFHLEVVRADAKGGNRNVLRKMARYAELNHKGYFKHTFGHAHVRAVLWLTTSSKRAQHLHSLTKDLRHGAGLHWFGAYTARDASGIPETSLSQETVLNPMWEDISGERRSILDL